MSLATIAAPIPVAKDNRELEKLARKHGTPLYIYDLAQLRARVAEIQAALLETDVRLYFATMANDRPRVLRILAEAGVGACVNSMPHLALASRAGFSIDDIQFTSTGVRSDDMVELQRLGVPCNLDSLAQLAEWFRLGAANAGLRINAASLKKGREKDRIGIEAIELPKALSTASDMGCKITGLHIYLGTNCQSPYEMLPTLDAFFELASSVSTLEYLNLGGGLGINYQHTGPSFDLEAFGAGLAQLVKRLRSNIGRTIRIIFEPGRGLVAECGTFVTAVTDVKELDGRRLASVDGSIAIFPRPFHHPNVPHRIRQIRDKPTSLFRSGQETVIVGRTTFSKDILGTAFLTQDLRPGDLLAFDDAGAYSQSMASRFLGQPEPRVCFTD